MAELNGDCEEEDGEAEDAEADGDGDDEAPRQRSADDEPRRNKRKNFKPRNILYDDEGGAAQLPQPQQPQQHSDSDGDDNLMGMSVHAGLKRRSRKPLFAPQKRYAAEEDGSPAPRFGVLDLSAGAGPGATPGAGEDDSSAEDDDSRSSYPTLNHLNSGPDDESSDVNLSDGGGGAPSASMLSRNHLMKPRIQVRHLDRDRDSSSAAEGDSSLDLSGPDSRLFGRPQVFGAPDDVLSRGSPRSPRGSPRGSPSAEDMSRREHDAMGSMAAHMVAAAALRRHPSHDSASAMKEYAEKTMRELLGIYGLGGAEMAEPLSNVPMANFASGELSCTKAKFVFSKIKKDGM